MQHVLPWAATQVVPVRAVVGVGMGGQGALRLAFRYPERFAAVASWNGVLDFHERFGRGSELDDMYERREQARQDTAVLHLRSGATPTFIDVRCDPAHEGFRGNDRLHEKLNALGVPHYYGAEPGCLVSLAAVGLRAGGGRSLPVVAG